MHPTTQLLRELVAIPSVNPMGRPLSGPEFLEQRLTDYLEQFFRSLGVRYLRQTVAPQRDNLIAFYEPPEAAWTLLLEVHQDTVPIDGMTIPPFGAHLENGLVSGRGACDVKGGMAAMLHAFSRLALEKPAQSARVVLACTVDEEFTFLGVQKLVEPEMLARIQAKGPTLAVVAEPTRLEIVQAHKGAVRWHLTTQGRSCHSSRPELGINAIYHMAALLPLLERHAADLMNQKRDALLGPATLSVGRIEGGTSVNTVPDRCRIEIDRRVLPGENALAIPSEVHRWLKEHAPEHIDFRHSSPWLSCPALSPQGNDALLQRLGQAIDRVRGHHEVQAVPYGTDASTLAEAGIPAVVFGPGNIDQAHTCDEWIDVEEVAVASEILYQMALR